jgi:hypothetical protein
MDFWRIGGRTFRPLLFSVLGNLDKATSGINLGQIWDNGPRDYQNRKGAEAPISKIPNNNWCLGPESNRYSREDRGILSPLRLPIPPPRHWILFNGFQMNGQVLIDGLVKRQLVPSLTGGPFNEPSA